MIRFHPQSYRVLDFYEWSQRKELTLQPKFQRRAVWSEKARSFLVDSIVKGLPIPKLFIREITDIKEKKTLREVVDGQQRLKAILDFIDGNLLMMKSHNEDFYGQTFNELPNELQERFLAYKFSVDLLEGASDEDVLNIFSRLNTYTLVLTAQEKINAAFFGLFKQTVYELGFAHYNFWIQNKILKDTNIARMVDAELTTELVIAMLDGLQQGKTSIKSFYKKYDEKFPHAEKIKKEFKSTIDLIAEISEDQLQNTRFRRLPLFYSLFCVIYDAKYGLPKSKKNQIKFTPHVIEKTKKALIAIDNKINWSKPQTKYSNFVQASGKGTAFLKYRQIRHEFIWKTLFGS